MSDNATTTAGDELTACLLRIEAASLELGDALQSRKADRVWAAVEHNDHELSCLARIGKADETNGSAVAPIVNRIRRIARRNHTMARVFLDMMSRLLDQVELGRNNRAGVYDARGRLAGRPGALLIQDQG